MNQERGVVEMFILRIQYLKFLPGRGSSNISQYNMRFGEDEYTSTPKRLFEAFKGECFGWQGKS